MSADIIDGKAFAATIRAEVARDTALFREKTGIQPGLAVVLVGNDPASEVYVRNKGIQAKEAGFASLEYKLPADTTQEALLAKVAELNADPQVHGILVQLPLPKHLDADAVLNAITPDKDVDGFHPVNVGRLWTGNPVSIPCTPLGCSLILRDRLGDLAGKRAIVIGRSNIVGKPMAALLLAANATVTIAHSRTADLAAHTWIYHELPRGELRRNGEHHLLNIEGGLYCNRLAAVRRLCVAGLGLALSRVACSRAASSCWRCSSSFLRRSCSSALRRS